MKFIKDSPYNIDIKLLEKCGEWVLEKLGENGKKINVLLTGDSKIKELNKKFRGENFPTDVLSFPYHKKNLWGEIALSLERIKENAEEYGVKEEEEILRVLIHGILHLFGEIDTIPEKRRRMEEKQESLLREFQTKMRKTRNIKD